MSNSLARGGNKENKTWFIPSKNYWINVIFYGRTIRMKHRLMQGGLRAEMQERSPLFSNERDLAKFIRE